METETAAPALVGQVQRPVGRQVQERNSDGGLTGLVMQCAFAVLAGQATVTISATGKRPAGFPRGELLSVGTDGSHNYATCPVKVLAWVHARTSKTPNAIMERPGAAFGDRSARTTGCAAKRY